MIRWKCLTGTFNIKRKEGERELTSGETESVHKEGHSTKFRKIDINKVEWKIPSDKKET
jgi:hypothetical protein